MSRNFLLYWLPETVERHLNESYRLDHVGSNQLNRVAAGDILWIVTTGEADALGLAGKLHVGTVVSFNEAKRRLGREDLWRSRWHALAAPGTARQMSGISLFDAAGELRFVDEGAVRLTVSAQGGVALESLRRMRELDAESGRLLSRIFSDHQLIEIN